MHSLPKTEIWENKVSKNMAEMEYVVKISLRSKSKFEYPLNYWDGKTENKPKYFSCGEASIVLILGFLHHEALSII